VLDRRQFVSGAGGLAAGAFGSAAEAQGPTLQDDARDAWLYVLPLIEMAAARIRMTDPNRPGQHAGLNVFAHAEHLVGPEDRGITTPNNDTLYSNSFIDLSKGPLTLTVPDAGSRYLSVAVMDMFTNNNVILGARTPGGAAGTWRLVGPGAPLKGPRDLRIKTPHAWVLSRVLVDGPSDLDAAKTVQHRVMLSGPAAARPPVYATRADPWSAYYKAADALLHGEGPGALAGHAAFERLKSACATRDFAVAGYSAEQAAAIEAGVKAARAAVEGARAQARFVQGWNYPPHDLGDYGDDYLYRAIISVAGLGALTPPEAMYMRASAGDGTPVFKGDGLYRFSLPRPIPVNSFWSLTMYEATADGQFFLTGNPLNRYAIGDRTQGLKRSPDGGLDIWIGRHDPGGERTSNWLPAPRSGPFSLTLRAYLPKPELLSGAYRLPPVTAA